MPLWLRTPYSLLGKSFPRGNPRRRGPIMTAQQLTARRNALGLTQAALAERLGVPLKTLQGWEQGRKCPPLLDVALRALEYEERIREWRGE